MSPVDEQLSALERAHALDPGNEEIAYSLGLCYERTGWTYQGRTIQEMGEALLVNDRGLRFHCAKVRVLGLVGFRLVPYFLEAIRREETKKGYGREDLIVSLGMLGSSAILPILDSSVKCLDLAEVVTIMALIGGPANRYLAKLVERARVEGCSDYGREFFENLIRLSDDSNIDCLLGFLGERITKAYKNRYEALQSLYLLGSRGRSLLPAIVKSYESNRGKSLQAAPLTALAAIAGEEGRNLVFEALYCPSDEVSKESLIALAHIQKELIPYRIEHKVKSILECGPASDILKARLLLARWSGKELAATVLRRHLSWIWTRGVRVLEDLLRSYPDKPDAVMLFLTMVESQPRYGFRPLLKMRPRSLLAWLNETMIDSRAIVAQTILDYVRTSVYPVKLFSPLIEKASTHKSSKVRRSAAKLIERRGG